jgi:hypothetical protein
MPFSRSEEIDHKIDRALSHFKEPNSDEFGYLDTYPALVALFRDLNFSRFSHVQAAACAVYGWMPRTLRYQATRDKPRYETLGKLAEQIRGQDAAVAIDALEEVSIFDISINNSVVGTSKFLHFIAPHALPIWDDKIARYFNSRSDKPADYIAYCKTIHRMLNSKKNIAWPISLPSQLNTPSITPVRKLEFCLFQAAQMTG